ncbi:MAG: DUF3754 domain-containing protein [Planctomycetes bacterium]|nr:DUF3754 domain-containing protein [Planctomycetota bacterium]
MSVAVPADAAARDHALPIARSVLVRRLLEAPAFASWRIGLERVAGALTDLLHVEYHRQAERLKDLYAPLDPAAVKPGVPVIPAQADAFSTALRQLLARANYQVVSADELDLALKAESVFQVKLHTRLSDFAELTLFARGRGHRHEIVRSWFGLRRRLIDVEFFEHVALFVRFQPDEHFAPRKRAKLPFKPGTTTLKLFADIPVADLEMLLPNSEVRMRTLDQLVLGVPALLGSLGIFAQLSAALLFVVGLGLSIVGLGEKPAMVTQGELVAFGAALFTVGIFASRQLARFRFKKLQFLKTLTENLYYRNLDNNAGVIHHLVDSAEEEEAKEAILGYAFLLAHGPATETELDTRIETWLAEVIGKPVDFEVDDALAKLQRFNLVTREGERFAAVAIDQAMTVIGKRWNDVLGV